MHCGRGQSGALERIKELPYVPDYATQTTYIINDQLIENGMA
jgi:hypothetical protein